MRKLGLVFVLVAWVAPAWATVITTGDVDPGGAGTQPDPWIIYSQLNIGNTDTGTLNVTAGGKLFSTFCRIGYRTGSTGVATITGAGSKWTNSGDVYLGRYGSGTLNVMTGGEVQNLAGRIGWESGSTGVATVKGVGSKWTNSDDLYVGFRSNGTLNVEAGGEVFNTYGYTGYKSSSTGIATVTGAGSKWTNSDDLSLGRYGSGTLNVEAGGEVSNTTGFIGRYSGSTGIATVSGAGSKWTNSSYLYVGDEGNGTLKITDGGLVEVGTETWVAANADSTGFIYFDNGTLSTGGLISSLDDLRGTGTINTHSLVSDLDLIFNSQSSLTQSWTLNDSERNISINLLMDGTGSVGVGHGDSATLRITAGVNITSLYGYVGYKSGSSGIATVDGAGSKWTNSDDLYVGRYGSGTLNVEAGGEVSNTTGFIGRYSGSTGIATVSGAGSKWTNSSYLYVGDEGNGTLKITDGGLVEVGTETWVAANADSTGFIYFDNGTLSTGGLISSLDDLRGTGTINTHSLVSDLDLIFNSQSSLTQSWTLNDSERNISINLLMDGTGSVGVGHGDSATLRITAGVNITSLYGYVGYKSGSSGIATVDGAGSKWTNSDDLYVGRYGSGTLNVEAGGEVSNTTGFIGRYSGSTGIATVNGAGSKWTNSGGLVVGYEGEGTLNVEAGGVVSSSDGYIGWLSDSTGIATVSGAGSKWTTLPGWNKLSVGLSGNGTLNVEAGGEVSNTDGFIGRYSGSTGIATVNGAGSKWTNSYNLTVGNFGDGELNITDGGLVEVGTETWVGMWDDSTGFIHFDNGTLTTGSLYSALADLGGTGTINTHSLVSDVDLVFDATHGLTQSFTLSNPGQNITVHLDVDGTRAMGAGYSGTGTLRVADGVTVVSTGGYIGYNSGSTGIATVTGAGSKWTNSEKLSVGLSGNGTLNVEAGGEVTSEWGLIGSGPGSTGIATVTGTGSKWTASSSWHSWLQVGESGSGTLNVKAGGQVFNQEGYIGSVGIATVTGAGSKWTNSRSLNLGGTLNVEAGGEVSNTTGFINSYSGSTGIATITGAGSKWNNTDNLLVGKSGGGTLNVEAGGEVTSDYGYIGSGPGSTGVATISGAGSKWTNSSYLYVGDEGNGTLNITDGGLVEVGTETWVRKTDDSIGFIHFDNGTLSTGGLISSLDDLSGTGTINTHGLVSDIDLVFDATHGLTKSFTLANPGQNIAFHLDVDGTGSMGAGYSSSGTLRIADGVMVSSLLGYVAYKAGSTGVATITGAGSKWTNSDELYVGSFGGGTLNVEAGGEVTSRSGSIGSGSTGIATVTGAGSKWTNSDELYVGHLGSGTLSVEAGGEVSNTCGYIGEQSGSTGEATVTGTGSRWTNSVKLYVGYEGDGTLNVEAGGEVSSDDGYVGYFSASTGIATVTGAGSKWTNFSDLYVGSFGGSTLTVEAGGEVSSSYGSIGYYSGSAGVATVTGAGSKWTSTSDLRVGNSGDGSLGVEAGGEVSNYIGYIGRLTDSTGIATITGAGSKWTSTSDLRVGNSGDGSLGVEAGGVVSSSDGYIGRLTDSTGIATITGAGSKWTNSGYLYVGRRGNATLTVEAGGEVSSSYGFIGRYSGSTGIATVTGGGSKWTNSGSLYIGGESSQAGGNGTLNVNDSGLVTVLGTIKLWDEGTINLDGGTLDTSALDLTFGTFHMVDGLLHTDGVNGNVAIQGGIFAPGHSPAVVSITGDYTQGADATLEIELAGTGGGEFDLLMIGGTGNLDGTLNLVPLTPYTDPTTRGTADEFVIIAANAGSGAFNTVQYNGSALAADFGPDGNGSFRSHVGGGLFRNLTYTATTAQQCSAWCSLVRLQNLLALPGDTDGDMDVDLSDYNTITTNFDPIGTYGPYLWQDGNFDGDGNIDLSDYNALASNFQPLGYGAAAVPEPTSLCLLLGGLLAAVVANSGPCRIR